MTAIHASELRPGDIVVYHGESHRVAAVERRAGWAWPVAFDAAGWAMALGDDTLVVYRAAA